MSRRKESSSNDVQLNETERADPLVRHSCRGWKSSTSHRECRECRIALERRGYRGVERRGLPDERFAGSFLSPLPRLPSISYSLLMHLFIVYRTQFAAEDCELFSFFAQPLRTSTSSKLTRLTSPSFPPSLRFNFHSPLTITSGTPLCSFSDRASCEGLQHRRRRYGKFRVHTTRLDSTLCSRYSRLLIVLTLTFLPSRSASTTRTRTC